MRKCKRKAIAFLFFRFCPDIVFFNMHKFLLNNLLIITFFIAFRKEVCHNISLEIIGILSKPFQANLGRCLKRKGSV